MLNKLQIYLNINIYTKYTNLNIYLKNVYAEFQADPFLKKKIKVREAIVNLFFSVYYRHSLQNESTRKEISDLPV